MGDAGSERSKAPSLPPRCPCGFWGTDRAHWYGVPPPALEEELKIRLWLQRELTSLDDRSVKKLRSE